MSDTILDLSTTEAGKFRANPNASEYNSFSAAHPTAPGTNGQDSLEIDTSGFSGGEKITGIRYTGPSGSAAIQKFSKQQRPDAQEIEYSIELPALSASYDPTPVRDAVLRAIARNEHNPIVTIAYDDGADTLTIVHNGSGTMDKLEIDGAVVGTNTRT